MLKEGKTDQEVEGDLKSVVGGIKGRMGVKEGEVTIYDGGESQIAGYTEKGSKDIGFNVGKNGVDLNNGADIWEKGVHESAHAAGENEKWAGLRGEAAKEAWKRENEYNGNRTGISEVNQASWVTQQKSKGQESAINQGTQRAGSVTKFDGYLPQGVPVMYPTLGSVLNTAFQVDTGMGPEDAMKKIGEYQYEHNPVMLGYRAGYVVGMELSGAGDLIRIGAGLDPYTGEKLTFEDRASQAGQFLLMRNLGGIGNAGNNILGNTFSQKQIESISKGIKYGKSLRDLYEGYQREFHQK